MPPRRSRQLLPQTGNQLSWQTQIFILYSLMHNIDILNKFYSEDQIHICEHNIHCILLLYVCRPLYVYFFSNGKMLKSVTHISTLLLINTTTFNCGFSSQWSYHCCPTKFAVGYINCFYLIRD